MRRRLLLSLCSAMLITTMFSGYASAVPMQRTVTVVDDSNKIVYQENILYNNEYKKPVVKTTPEPVAETKNVSRQARSAAPATSRSGSDVRSVLKTAVDLLGKPYAYGASGPNSFDCSGFTMYVFGKHGINLPHNAASQYQAGVKVSRGDLIAGDLVFFGYYGSAGIQHVGIYTGDGMFIHSSTSQGVIRTSMSAAYYAGNYKGAARILR